MSANAGHIRRYRERWHRADTRSIIGGRIASHVMHVPEDVERREETDTNCFNCGARGGCRHRPWKMLADA